jgi:hypothetical protein
MQLEDEAQAEVAVLHQHGLRQAGDLQALEEDPPGCRRIQPADQVQQGGFARAAFPGDHHRAALLDHQADVVQDGQVLGAGAEYLAQARNLQERVLIQSAAPPWA